METYVSKNKIEAFQVTDEMFIDVTKATEAQKLPLKEVHYAVEGHFCTLNCITKQLIYKGVALNIGDYLIRSGSSLEPCSKDKFEADFGLPEEIKDILEEEIVHVIDEVEEMIKENPETAPFIDKVGSIVKAFFAAKDTTPNYEEGYVKGLEEEVKELRELLDKYIEYAYTKIQPLDPNQSANMTIYEIIDYQLNQLNENGDEAEPLETEEDIADAIVALMDKSNVSSIIRQEVDGVMENHFEYFEEDGNGNEG